MSTAAPPFALLYELGLLDESGNSTRRAIAGVNLPSNTMESYYDIAYTALSGLSCLIVIVCSVAIFLHLRRSIAASHQLGAVPANHQSSQSRRAHARQINAILLVQALIPLVFDFIPANATTAAFTILNIDSLAKVVAFINAWLAWAPVVNAAAIILVVSPYRQALFKRSMNNATTLVVTARRETKPLDTKCIA